MSTPRPDRRFQFSLATLALGVVFAAVVLGSFGAVWRLLNSMEREVGLIALWVMSPIWLPGVFVAFALGRRRLSIWTAGAFVVTEAVVLASLYWRF